MDVSNPFYQLYDTVRSCRNNQGQLIAEPFFHLPSKKKYPDYYQQIKMPISLQQIDHGTDRASWSHSPKVTQLQLKSDGSRTRAPQAGSNGRHSCVHLTVFSLNVDWTVVVVGSSFYRTSDFSALVWPLGERELILTSSHKHSLTLWVTVVVCWTVSSRKARWSPEPWYPWQRHNLEIESLQM